MSVVTFYDEQGRVHGLTANAVCSVSLHPPLVLVCIDQRSRSHRMLGSSNRLVMNLLSDKQQEECRYFSNARPTGQSPFKFRSSSFNFPVLDGCMSYMDCKIVARHSAGDHTIFVAEVQEMDTIETKPLVYHSGTFAGVGGGV